MKQKIQIVIAFILAIPAIPAILVIMHFFAYALFDVVFLPVPANNAESIGIARIFAMGISGCMSAIVFISSDLYRKR